MLLVISSGHQPSKRSSCHCLVPVEACGTAGFCRRGRVEPPCFLKSKKIARMVLCVPYFELSTVLPLASLLRLLAPKKALRRGPVVSLSGNGTYRPQGSWKHRTFWEPRQIKPLNQTKVGTVVQVRATSSIAGTPTWQKQTWVLRSARLGLLPYPSCSCSGMSWLYSCRMLQVFKQIWTSCVSNISPVLKAIVTFGALHLADLVLQCRLKSLIPFERLINPLQLG